MFDFHLSPSDMRIDLASMVHDEEHIDPSDTEDDATSAQSLSDPTVYCCRVYSLKPLSVKSSITSDSSPASRFDNRLIITVVFEGCQYDALLDTGATASCIRRDIAILHHKTIDRVQGTVSLAQEGVTIPRIGLVHDVELHHGCHIVSAPFEVLLCHYPFIIGIDLFHKLGLSISGIDIPQPDHSSLFDCEIEGAPSSCPTSLPDDDVDPDKRELIRRGMQAIEPLLRDNENIPVDSACTIPEMLVRLEVPPNVTLFRRPRNFAEKELTIMDDAIEKWLSQGIIGVAPVGCPHNNTLTLAAKKDADA
ncbi:hypothetical protein DFQ26_000697 [Actinomortierella ambigua]|nr:hypothetical protein DFQ26_000697 [Actinomortierella ambigua]